MASVSFAPDLTRHRRIPLAEIDAVVSARLGATRGLGNSQPACFNRQVAMYLAKTLGGWTTTVIGRFYNGRDHSTVCYGIQRIEALRESDPDVDALITSLKDQLTNGGDSIMANADIKAHRSAVRLTGADLEKLSSSVLLWQRGFPALRNSETLTSPIPSGIKAAYDQNSGGPLRID